MKKIVLIFLSLVLLSSCDKGDDTLKCDDDQNGIANDKCAKVRSDFKNYKSDGKTFENVKLVFIQGTGNSNLFINSKKGFLLTKGIYTEGVSYTFSGRSLQNKLTVNIFEVNTDAKGTKTMSGQFTFEGTFERNSQSFNVTKTGSFDKVNF